MSNQWSNRVSFARRSKGLEPDEGKLSRPVLRGPGGSNPARLPGIFDRCRSLVGSIHQRR